MTTQIELDLQASEVVIVTMLAHLGAAFLSGDKEAVQELGAMIMRIADSNAVAERALEKLEASLAMAKAVLDADASGAS
jgi:hypothetical protein